MSVNKNKHFTLSERIIIETGINNGSTKSALSEILGKDKSTVGKEIKAHRVLKHSCPLPLECSNYRGCPYERKCSKDCPEFSQFVCNRRDRSPGACNGCSTYKTCRFNKYFYLADTAHHEYQCTKTESREGFNITTEEVKRIGTIIEPLVKKGLSIYAILQAHPEIKKSEKTIYTYIEANLFKSMGIDLGVMDLRKQVNRKLPKAKKNQYKPRNDHSYLKGRLYEDYLSYIEENPNAKVLQLDTVYNDVSNGPFMQTFKFIKYNFLFSLLHQTKDSASMNKGILMLEEILGSDLFNREAEVLLTDRGSEFMALRDIEFREDGSRRFRLFYCDPMQSCQKGSLENNHIELRYILPKETDLRDLGLTSQQAMNSVLSHVNSFPKENLDGKSSFEVLQFFNKELMDKFLAFGLEMIKFEKLILKPYLLKSLKK